MFGITDILDKSSDEADRFIKIKTTTNIVEANASLRHTFSIVLPEKMVTDNSIP